ncbi:MAG: zf-TFIIB domain-containing protein [Chloroflexi bacterium]|nr:zf-TFIIB domain-containing protein [Chloroflexota bacterium]
MTCPVCSASMSPQDFGGVSVDVCDSCKGIWFDWSELGKVEGENADLTAALKDALASPRHPDEDREKISCPKCSLSLHRHIYKMVKGVSIDECYECGGFFLDAGELKVIRETEPSPQQRAQYCQNLVGNLPEYQQAQMGLARQQLRANAMRAWVYASAPLGPGW